MSLRNELIAVAIGCTLLAVSHIAIYQMGAMSTEAAHAEELQKISNASAQAVIDAQAETRAAERKSVLDMKGLDAAYQEKLSHEIDSRDRTIAGLRSGAYSVRDRFACPASTAKGGTGEAGPSTGLGDGQAAAGLQATDAEFLLSEAGRADEVTVQLQACQAIVQQDRGE